MTTRDRAWLGGARRWVVKVGSALLTNDGQGIDEHIIGELVRQLSLLRRQNIEVLLVSSGAVAAGLSRLGVAQRPVALDELQAAAAVGQTALLRHYEVAFAQKGLLTAQVLLVNDDVLARDRYLNARATLTKLLDHGVVPIINENDTVATDEFRLGDNDTLAGLVANLVDADLLVLLTDQLGLFDRDPRSAADATLIRRASSEDPRLDAMAGGGGALGRGGMITKLRAARIGARSGTQAIIASGREKDVLSRIANGDDIGTWLESGKAPETARRRWLAGLLTVKGELELDDGAARVLCEARSSLLPVGVHAVRGEFSRGDVLLCRDAQGRELARGLSNYPSTDVRRILGRSSKDIPTILGYGGDAELIHRDNMVLL